MNRLRRRAFNIILSNGEYVASDAPVTIYMPLADMSDWRPVKAIRQREDIYCVLGPMAEGEAWKFPPGSMVRRKPKIMRNGKQEMIAAEL